MWPVIVILLLLLRLDATDLFDPDLSLEIDPDEFIFLVCIFRLTIDEESTTLLQVFALENE